MNYCSIEDAFGSPGCKADYSTKEARREERRKAKRCRGPTMNFLGIKDPDRQHLEKTPMVPAMNSFTGLREHEPVDAPQGESEPFENMTDGIESELQRQRLSELLPRTDGDPIGDKQRSTLPLDVAASYTPWGASKAASKAKGFFGADPDEGFADYIPDSTTYLLQPSLTSAFQRGSAALPIPSVRDVWKPLTPTGVQTSYFESLPRPGGEYPTQKDSYESLNRKIDRMMSRLDEMQRGNTTENSQKEILLFISSGVFVLFLMDLLVKKGGRL
jgi:hypothetical protein